MQDNYQFGLARQVLDLCQTVEEGLKYLKLQSGLGKMGNTGYLFIDICNAFMVISNSLEAFEDDSAKMDAAFSSVDISLQAMINLYADQSFEQAWVELQYLLLPAFETWQDSLQKYLQPYLQ